MRKVVLVFAVMTLVSCTTSPTSSAGAGETPLHPRFDFSVGSENHIDGHGIGSGGVTSAGTDGHGALAGAEDDSGTQADSAGKRRGVFIGGGY